MPKQLVKHITPQIVIIVTAIVSILVIVIAFAYSSKKPDASYEVAQLGPVTQEIDTTGTIKAADSLNLSFDVGGRIGSVPAKVGAHVVAGQTLAALSAGDLAANVSQAKAALAMQQAKLDGLRAGARPEDLAVSQTAVQGAQSAVDQAAQSLLSSAQDAYVKSDDAIHNKVDLFFDNPRSSQPRPALSFSNGSLANEMISGRVAMETLLTEWQTSLAAQTTQSDSTALAAKTRANLDAVSKYLDTVSAGLSTAIPSTFQTTAIIQGYQTSVATGRTNVSASLSAFNTAFSAQQSAQSALATSKSQLTLKQAGTQGTDIAAQEAAVASAQASVDLAQAQLGKTVIRAPIAGTVVRNDYHLGETAASGVSLITLNSDSEYQVETYVSEADVPHIAVGQDAEVRIDAYADAEAFTASVIGVDPAATMQNGVASYKVTLQFKAPDPRIKSGLTANVRIVSGSKDQALTVPTSAVVTRGSDQYVLRANASGDELVKVTTGIHGAGGTTEILSGLTVGDRIRSFGNQ